APATIAEVQAMITAVNNNVNAILVQIGNEGDQPNVVPSVVTVAQLQQLPVTGVTIGHQLAYQAFIDANPNNFSMPATLSEIQAMINSITLLASPYPAGTVFCSIPTQVVEVTSTTGRVWMDRNLGAGRVATSLNDANSYGDLYQWGRFSDGHQCRNSLTTSTNASTAAPNGGNSWDGQFIIENVPPQNWLTSQDNTLWQGLAGINNPCPTGFRLPTEAELNAERVTFVNRNNVGAFASVLKLPAGGARRREDGSLTGTGIFGDYWSSTTSGINIRRLTYFNAIDSGNIDLSLRADGYAVRCIKN
ncbi:hypothetical protein CHU92_11185, partial [Flavobacterium cyanobacteriorum]